MKLRDHHAEVRGVYDFERMETASVFPIGFPIARAPSMGPPEIEDVHVVDGNRAPIALPFIQDEGGLHLALPGGPAGLCRLEIAYRLRIHGHRVEYLLTSARRWKDPIDSARLEVLCANSVREPRFSLPLAPVARSQDGVLYRCDFRCFRPQTELIVEW